MRIVIAPDSFKGSAPAGTVAAAIADGWRHARPGDEIRLLPMADGGEGTAAAIATAHPGATWHEVRDLCGPDSRSVCGSWLELPDGTGVVDLAESSGITLMRALDPLGAHTYGLGQLIAAALDHGVGRLVVGLGGSASTDGGTGALTALGARLLDSSGGRLPLGGSGLRALAEVDLTGLRSPPPGGVSCLTDVTSPLLGPMGAAAVFGPQKGATPRDVATLEAGLARLTGHLGGDPAAPGAGAAGGSGYGFAAAWRASLRPGASSVARLVGLPGAVSAADLVITGEGAFDTTSRSGKVVGHVLNLCADAGVPTAIIAGRLAISAPCPAVALADLAPSTGEAMRNPAAWLRRAAAALARRLPS